MCWNRGSIYNFASPNLQILCHFQKRFCIKLAVPPLKVNINICYWYSIFWVVGPEEYFGTRLILIRWNFSFFVSCYDHLSGWVNWYVSLSVQGPFVQSVVSLTSSLRVISLTVLGDSIYNILIFFAEKIWVACYSHFFSKRFQHICVSLDVNFNESLTNDIVSFEQLGPAG